jgi:uroporphyrinogen III methyltransferase/synthase
VNVGKAYFIGAGPGDPGLLPLKSAEALREADVILYDRLVSVQLLKHARPGARFIYVGKESGHHTVSQTEINELIVTEAKRGQIVVRLKGGDPGIFGRVGEEAEACGKHLIPFEIIPGVTSGIGAACYAGIPLTHRELSSNVAFISGHRSAENEDDEMNWTAFAGLDTLVFYMGVSELPRIRSRLIAAGKPPETPAALIRWGTSADQMTCVGTLERIADLAQEKQIRPPALLVVGEVVKLRETMNWFEQKPLFGKRVLMFADSLSVKPCASFLSSNGAETAEVPWISQASIPAVSISAQEGGWNWDVFAEYMKEWERGRSFNTLWVSGARGLSGLLAACAMRKDWADRLRRIPEMIVVGEQAAVQAREQGWQVTATVCEGEPAHRTLEAWLAVGRPVDSVS